VNPGTDFAVGYGTPIVAAHGGIVAIADSNPDGSGGRMVAIKNGDHETQYLHLSKVLVKNGQKLKQGAKIGLAGGSGFGKDRHYGTHLHFAYKVKGKNVDPEKYIAK
jgi:murein DD-endopeptidase